MGIARSTFYDMPDAAADDATVVAQMKAICDGRNRVQGQFARQQSQAAHVRFGSKADIAGRQSNVRFTPKGRHSPNDCLKLNQLKRTSLGRIPIVGPNTLQKKKAAVVVAAIDD